MTTRTLTLGVLVATLALGACGGGSDDGDGIFGQPDSSPSADFELPESSDDGASDSDFQERLDEALDDFVEGGLGQEENSIDDDGDNGVADEETSATPLLDNALLTSLPRALEAIGDEHGLSLAAKFIRVNGDDVEVATDDDGTGYVYDGSSVRAQYLGDLGTFGPETVDPSILDDVDLETLVLMTSDEAGFDPGRVVDITIGRSRLDPDLTFARMIVWTDVAEGYVDVTLDGEILVDNVG
jgi:hypothetical protein